MIRPAFILLCAGTLLGCGLFSDGGRHGAGRTTTSTYVGRLEAGSVVSSGAAKTFGSKHGYVPRPGHGDSEPHWTELLEPLREFNDEDWARIRKVQRHVNRAARDEGLSPSLLNGVIWVESKFFPKIRGSRGPRGLMQLMPVTARSIAKRLERPYRPYNPDFNIRVGAYYLARMLKRFDGDLHLALAAYNQGPRHILEWIDEGAQSPKPRMPYVSRVYRAAHAFCERLSNPKLEPRRGVYVCPRMATGPVADAEAGSRSVADEIAEARLVMASQQVAD